MRVLYTLLFYAAVPLIVGRLYWKSRRIPAYRQRIAERFGRYPADCERSAGVLWIHAVSVGETEAAAPLIRALLERHPETRILVTSTTPTGSARVRALFGPTVAHCYLPYDLPHTVRRFLEYFRPRAAVIMETEIWPNLLASCKARGIPIVFANARMSQRSADGYRRARAMIAPCLEAAAAIGAQTEDDARRYAELGAEPRRIQVTGNVKFDIELSDDARNKGIELRTALFGERPVMIGASTHEGEERALLSAFRSIRAVQPHLLLALAPRHPDRCDQVASLCEAQGLKPVRRSERRACGPDDRVFLIDTLGELRMFYVAADLAFVGGSLVPTGGHNVLEPAVAGCAILFGPHVANFAEICSGLLAAGGAVQIADAATLAERAAELLADLDLRGRLITRASGFVAANRGALDRTLALIEGQIYEVATGVTASGVEE
ncbi:MAG: lipid IV(A) 3-deoxy-D-manno-octulosonic acid transferase [Methylotetracoccus sp.]